MSFSAQFIFLIDYEDDVIWMTRGSSAAIAARYD